MRYVKAAVLATAAVLLAGVLAQPARAEVTFDLEYSNLSQHGSWLVSAEYGHVWQPREYNREWNPYYDGHWVNTDLGWTWVSDYEWGAIPYHYGTWVADRDAGWVWIPGNIWAPSWVTFRTGPDYIGWAPVPPRFSIGVSIELGGPLNFLFVSSRDFLAPRVRESIIPRERANVFMNNTTVVNNIVVENNVVVNRGPDVRTVEKAIGRPIRVERIESVARVAPFQNVSRAQLAVEPARVKQGLRVAEPVPASQPLPVSDKRGNGEPNISPADAPKPMTTGRVARPNTPEPVTPPAAVIPSGAADISPKARSAQTHPRKDNANAQQTAEAQATAKANAEQGAKDQASAKANAEQSAMAQANAKAHAAQGAKDQANAKAKAEQSAMAQANAKARAGQGAKDQATAKAQANAKAHAEQGAKDQATAKAKAEQSAKAQATAKAKADAKAKKPAPDKPNTKDPSADKGTSPETKEETPR